MLGESEARAATSPSKAQKPLVVPNIRSPPLLNCRRTRSGAAVEAVLQEGASTEAKRVYLQPDLAKLCFQLLRSVASSPAAAAVGLDGPGFDGVLDDVSLWDRPLSADEVAAHFAAGSR